MQLGTDKTNRTKPKECLMVIVMSCACWVEIGHFLSHFLCACTLRANAVREDREIQTQNAWRAQEVTLASNHQLTISKILTILQLCMYKLKLEESCN